MTGEEIRDLFQAFAGSLQIRRMFGGQGIYRDGLMFALEAGGELYLKTDGETVEAFRNLNSRPFSYTAKNGKRATMSYWLMPDAGWDDPDEAARYAEMAFGAARRAARAKA